MIFKFEAPDPLLQSPSGGINSFHLMCLKSQQNQVLIPSSRKVQAKDTQKASLHTQLASLSTYWED